MNSIETKTNGNGPKLLRGHIQVPSRLHLCRHCCKVPVESWSDVCPRCTKMLADIAVHRENQVSYRFESFIRRAATATFSMPWLGLLLIALIGTAGVVVVFWLLSELI